MESRQFGEIEMEITLKPGTTTGQELSKKAPNIYEEFLLPKGQKFKVKQVEVHSPHSKVAMTIFVETIK